MSIIDSGLGWSCDSDYYVYNANTTVGYQYAWGHGYSKKQNDGAAVAVGITVGSTTYGRYNTAIISTIKDNAAIHWQNKSTGGAYLGAFDIDGVQWHMYCMEAGNNNQSENSYFPYYPDTFSGIESVSSQSVVRTLLDFANVQVTLKKIPTTDYVKAFVEGVEAETATRVNALDTAKQPKTMSAAVSVGGVSQSTVESAIGAMASRISKIDFDIHRDLGTEITAAQKLAIAHGTFEDLPIGAYWTLNNTVYRIAHHDYYLGTGDTECTSHHIVVVPDNNMYSAVMNDTNTTVGGYAGSKMRAENLASALSKFEADFGVAHILNHRILITDAVTDGQASGWIWVDSKVDLMSENMVYGHPVWGKSGNDTGIERGQLMLFSIFPNYIQKQRTLYWLRSVSSGSYFCTVGGLGAAGDSASGLCGVRPYACIYFDDVLT